MTHSTTSAPTADFAPRTARPEDSARPRCQQPLGIPRLESHVQAGGAGTCSEGAGPLDGVDLAHAPATACIGGGGGCKVLEISYMQSNRDLRMCQRLPGVASEAWH